MLACDNVTILCLAVIGLARVGLRSLVDDFTWRLKAANRVPGQAVRPMSVPGQAMRPMSIEIPRAPS